MGLRTGATHRVVHFLGAEMGEAASFLNVFHDFVDMLQVTREAVQADVVEMVLGAFVSFEVSG